MLSTSRPAQSSRSRDEMLRLQMRLGERCCLPAFLCHDHTVIKSAKCDRSCPILLAWMLSPALFRGGGKLLGRARQQEPPLTPAWRSSCSPRKLVSAQAFSEDNWRHLLRLSEMGKPWDKIWGGIPTVISHCFLGWMGAEKYMYTKKGMYDMSDDICCCVMPHSLVGMNLVWHNSRLIKKPQSHNATGNAV